MAERAEQLADWFEASGPSPDSQRPVADYYLEYIAEIRHRTWGEVAAAVSAARNAGATWPQIGEALAVSAAEAESRFGRAVEAAKIESALQEVTSEAAQQ